MSTNYVIDELPGVLPFYLRALKGRPGFRDGDHVPRTRVEWPRFEFDQASIDAYSHACSLEEPGNQVPLFFPHSFFGPLHLLMLTDQHFPLRVLGGLHLRNHIIQHRPMHTGQHYSAALWFSDQRRRPQGLEVDFRTEISAESQLHWESVTTFLFRKRFEHEDPESPLATVLASQEDAQPFASFPIPANTGKHFGRITRDINPIHMSRLLAKAFGFERDLCHGMWALARSQALIEGVDYSQPVRSDVVFKGPLYIGREVEARCSGGDSHHYELYSGTNPRPCVLVGLDNVAEGVSLG